MGAINSRVFNNGNSQAVRIPAQFRLNATQVSITRTEDGGLLIHPLPLNRGEALVQALQGFDDDFIVALETDRAKALPAQEREAL